MNRQMQISQETFDQTVDENIEEFGMERPEALKEAILQFTAQGILIYTSKTTELYLYQFGYFLVLVVCLISF